LTPVFSRSTYLFCLSPYPNLKYIPIHLYTYVSFFTLLFHKTHNHIYIHTTTYIIILHHTHKKGSKLGPGIDPDEIRASGLDPIDYVKKKIDDHEHKINKLREEASVEANKNMYGTDQGEGSTMVVDVPIDGTPVSQSDIDKVSLSLSLCYRNQTYIHISRQTIVVCCLFISLSFYLFQESTLP